MGSAFSAWCERLGLECRPAWEGSHYVLFELLAPFEGVLGPKLFFLHLVVLELAGRFLRILGIWKRDRASSRFRAFLGEGPLRARIARSRPLGQGKLSW